MAKAQTVGEGVGLLHWSTVQIDDHRGECWPTARAYSMTVGEGVELGIDNGADFTAR